MSDNYCPPPEVEDYVKNPISYPMPVGKESTSGPHNDINYDEPIRDKNTSSDLDLSGGLLVSDLGKIQVSIKPESTLRSEKLPSQINSLQTNSVKNQKPIISLNYQRSQKVVNII